MVSCVSQVYWDCILPTTNKSILLTATKMALFVGSSTGMYMATLMISFWWTWKRHCKEKRLTEKTVPITFPPLRVLWMAFILFPHKDRELSWRKKKKLGGVFHRCTLYIYIRVRSHFRVWLLCGVRIKLRTFGARFWAIFNNSQLASGLR